MITITTTERVRLTNPPQGQRWPFRENEFIDQTTAESAILHLCDLLQGSIEHFSVSYAVSNFDVELPARGRTSMGYHFSGYFQHLRPVVAVLRCALAIAGATGEGSLAPFVERQKRESGLLTEAYDAVMPELVVPVGKHRSQDWDRMAWEEPVKLAVILGLYPGYSPNAVRSDLLDKPLRTLVRQMLRKYESNFSVDLLQLLRDAKNKVSV